MGSEMKARFIAVVGRAITRFDPRRSWHADGQWPWLLEERAIYPEKTRHRYTSQAAGLTRRPYKEARYARDVAAHRKLAAAQSRKYCEPEEKEERSHFRRADGLKRTGNKG